MVLVQVQRPENQERQWSKFQSESLQTEDLRREMFQFESKERKRLMPQFKPIKQQ